MRILMICMQFPYPPNTGERIRNFNLIKTLSRRNDIFLISLVQSLAEEQYISEMKKYCYGVETVLLKRSSKLRHFPGILGCALRCEPVDNKFYFLKEMVQKIKRALSNENFDIIQIEHSYMAQYIRIIPERFLSRTFLTLHNIETVRLLRMCKVEGDTLAKIRSFLNWLWMREWEPAIAERFYKCLVMSELDRSALLSLNANIDVAVIPNGVDNTAFTPFPRNPQSQSILFIGTFAYPPNVDAVLYFCKATFPLILKELPRCNFIIVGGEPPKSVCDLSENQNVSVVGYVNDVRPYYEKCAVVVVPLRAGGGTRLKILEAMAFGRPVVSTSTGSEGIDVTNGDNIFIGDKPGEFARLVCDLIRSPMLQEKVANKARRLVESKYSWAKIGKDLQELYETCIEDRCLNIAAS